MKKSFSEVMRKHKPVPTEEPEEDVEENVLEDVEEDVEENVQENVEEIEEENEEENETDEPIKKELKFTFRIGDIRLLSLLFFLALLMLCALISKIYVYPKIPPETTVIFEIFGFNHACNVVDHNPARQVAALLIVFFTLPYSLFLFLQHVRLKYDVRKKRVPHWQLSFSRVVLPFHIYFNATLYMWFVNTPEITGFIPHYYPYLLFRISLGTLAFQQVQYLRARKRLPFGLSETVATIYMWLLIFISAFAQLCVFAIVAGNPILDSKNETGDRFFFQMLAAFQNVFLFLPILISWDIRNNFQPITITVSFPEQKDDDEVQSEVLKLATYVVNKCNCA